ncbi:MAG TPA: phosphoribosylamine--glycine ligase [Candidatus Cloacimonetes bacterium]|nr:phosphoribosylamine--glycine ligase [Candidatus Cloacimonadota bacterium]
MKILIIGSGGREHTLAWKFAQCSNVDKVFVAPGNSGMEAIAQTVQLTSIDELIRFAKAEEINLTFVGPEQPLADGIVDAFIAAELSIIGPTKKAAEIESSKVFAKQFMKNHKIPTADFEVFTDIKKALNYLKEKEFPVVIKADGLAAGKGVFISDNYTTAESVLNQIFNFHLFGEAGSRVVIEDFLAGEEASLFAFTDGTDFVSTILSQDHKQLLDGDMGPNTGGMGAYAPAVFSDSGEIRKKIDDTIIKPTLDGMKKEGRAFTGILYAGVIIKDGEPKVLEFNCRLGDPETQVILPLLDNDLLDVCKAIQNKRIKEIDLKWKNKSAVNVVMASGGYPGSYEKGYLIKGLDNLSQDTFVFFAGVKRENDVLVTNGGRVLSLTSLGRDLVEARQKVYTEVEKVTFTDCYYRTDIAQKGIAHLKKCSS